MGTGPRYLRFVALGDSATYGFGDPAAAQPRGWARLLGAAIASDDHVSNPVRAGHHAARRATLSGTSSSWRCERAWSGRRAARITPGSASAAIAARAR